MLDMDSLQGEEKKCRFFKNMYGLRSLVRGFNGVYLKFDFGSKMRLKF